MNDVVQYKECSGQEFD